jgi:hypothetical protein
MFIVAAATFQILYILIALDHDRRKITHFGVTENPTQVWLAHQITEAFPRDTAPRYLLPFALEQRSYPGLLSRSELPIMTITVIGF